MKQPQTNESRQFPRFNVDIQVSVSIANKHFSAHTRDISRSGLCLVSLEPIARETEIATELVLTFGTDGMSEPLNLLGKVAWCTALFGAYQIGVMFVKVDGEQARYLDMFIGFLDGSLSSGDFLAEEHPTKRSDPDDPFGV
jgi:hypothetical protein